LKNVKLKLQYFEIVMNLYKRIVTDGTFYNPATKHYPDKNIAVQCIKCFQTEIPACIGYEDLDLCLPCASNVIILMQKHQNEPELFEVEAKCNDNENYEPKYLTKMMQQQFAILNIDTSAWGEED